MVGQSKHKQPVKTKGAMIMQVADAIFPSLMKMFKDVRGEDGGLLQPSNVRGIALNVAQGLVNQQWQNA